MGGRQNGKKRGGQENGRTGKQERERVKKAARGKRRGEGLENGVSCPMISCHINIFELLIIGEYHAAEVGTSLQYEF